jgi:hypothetical protein
MKLTFQPKLEGNPRKEDLDLFCLKIDEFNILSTGK